MYVCMYVCMYVDYVVLACHGDETCTHARARAHTHMYL
jgi:hypothetical protein